MTDQYYLHSYPSFSVVGFLFVENLSPLVLVGFLSLEFYGFGYCCYYIMLLVRASLKTILEFDIISISPNP